MKTGTSAPWPADIDGSDKRIKNNEDSARSGMIGDWSASGDFFGAILAGIVLGFGADWLFGTKPLLLVLGAVAGFGVGFWRMYQIAKHAEAEELRKRAERPHP